MIIITAFWDTTRVLKESTRALKSKKKATVLDRIKRCLWNGTYLTNIDSALKGQAGVEWDADTLMFHNH